MERKKREKGVAASSPQKISCGGNLAPDPHTEGGREIQVEDGVIELTHAVRLHGAQSSAGGLEQQAVCRREGAGHELPQYLLALRRAAPDLIIDAVPIIIRVIFVKQKHGFKKVHETSY